MDENEIFSSFWGHIEELRRTFLRILLIIAVSVVASFLFYEPLISVLKSPLNNPQNSSFKEEKIEYFRFSNNAKIPKTITLLDNNDVHLNLSKDVHLVKGESYEVGPEGSLVYTKKRPSQELVVLGPLEGFLIALKTSFWSGLFISSPIWLLVLSQFFMPGLHPHERRLILPFIATSILFILMGCLFAYLFTIPLANQYLFAFNNTIGTNLWSLSNYLDYTLFLVMANGIAFELGAIGVFAVHLQFITAKGLIANRRYAILGAFVAATILTPPDILTQFMLAIPLCLLYEALIVYARLKTKTEQNLPNN